MLVVLTFVSSLASISADDVYANYRPPLPILEKIFGSVHVGDPPIYDYTKRYRDSVNVQFGDNQGLVFTDGVHRRIDTGNNDQYANQWGNGQNSWIYPNSHNTPNNNNGKQINQGNGNERGTQMNTQLDDVTRTRVNEEVSISRRKQDHSTEIDTQGTRNTKPKLLHEYVTNTDHRDTTSNVSATADNDSKDGRVTEDHKEPSNSNDNLKYGTKTTQDNEVTPKPEEKKKAGPTGDRWVWGSDVVETTTVTDLKDRAAFDVKTCPTNTVKFGNRCVRID